MKNKLKILIRPALLLLFLLLISIGITYLWNLKGYLIIGHDVGYKLNIQEFFNNLFYVWSDNLNFGKNKYFNPGAIPIHLPELVINLIVKDPFVSQFITLVYWHFLNFSPFILIYLLFYRKNNKNIIIFFLFATFLYAINLFNLQGWTVFWRTRFSIQIFLPIFFFFIYKTMEAKRINPFFLVAVLLLSVFLNGGGSPPLFGSLILAWFFIGLYFIFINKDKKATTILYAKVTFLYFLGFILMSSYWLLPTIGHLLKSFSTEFNLVGGFEGVTNWLRVVSKDTSFANMFRLEGIPSWYDNLSHPYANLYLNNKLLVGLSFIWPTLAFSAMFLVKEAREKKLIILVGMLALLGMFFAGGSHSPFDWLFDLMMRYIPGFTMFRTAFYKFAPLVWFSYSMLIAFSLYKITLIIKKRFVNKIVYLLFVFGSLIFIALYNFPFFSGNFFNWNKNFSTKVIVPSYVFDIKNWFNDDKNRITGRILLLPPQETAFNVDAYKWGYWSPEPLPNVLSAKTFVTSNTGNNITDALVKQLYKAILEGDAATINKLSLILDVEHVLVRNDFYYDNPGGETLSPQIFTNAIKSNDNFTEIKNFNQWSLFKIKNYFPSRFYIPSNIVLLSGDFDSLNEEISLLDKNDVIIEDNQMITLPVIAHPDSLIQNYSKIIILPEKIFYNPQVNLFDVLEIKLYPDSILYPLVEYKSKQQKNKLTSMHQRIDALLDSQVRKIKELEYLENESKDNYLEAQIGVITRELGQLGNLAEELNIFNRANYERKVKMNFYLRQFITKIKDLNSKYLDENIEIIGKIKTIRAKLKDDNLNGFDCLDECSIYSINIPLEGEYEMLLNKRSLPFIEKIEFENKIVPLSVSKSEKGWYVINTEYLKEDNFPLKIIRKTEKLAEDFVLDKNGPYNFNIKSGLNKFMIRFDYYLANNEEYFLTKNFENKISGHRWHRTVSLKGNDSYKEAFDFQNGDTLESLTLTPINEGKTKKPLQDKSEIRNLEVVNLEDIDLVFYHPADNTLDDAGGVTYNKINPVTWKINLDNKKQNAKFLVFSNSFDDGWILKDNANSRVMVNGNLNGWVLQDGLASKTTVYFQPQDNLYRGVFLSVVSIIAVAFVGMTIFVKRRMDKK